MARGSSLFAFGMCSGKGNEFVTQVELVRKATFSPSLGRAFFVLEEIFILIYIIWIDIARAVRQFQNLAYVGNVVWNVVECAKLYQVDNTSIILGSLCNNSVKGAKSIPIVDYGCTECLMLYLVIVCIESS